QNMIEKSKYIIMIIGNNEFNYPSLINNDKWFLLEIFISLNLEHEKTTTIYIHNHILNSHLLKGDLNEILIKIKDEIKVPKPSEIGNIDIIKKEIFENIWNSSTKVNGDDIKNFIFEGICDLNSSYNRILIQQAILDKSASSNNLSILYKNASL